MFKSHESPETTDLVSLIDLWLKRNQVELFLFDLDDTLVDTQRVFDEQIGKAFYLLFSRLPRLGKTPIMRRFEEIDKENFKRYGVNPKRLQITVALLGEEYHLPPQTRELMTQTVMGSYARLPPLKEGGLGLLYLLKKAKTRLGVVTHANQEWTNLKITGLGLGNFFEQVFVVDENQFKTPQSWREAMARFNVDPPQVAVVGDSLKGDIIAAQQVGVKHLFWLKIDSWNPYGEQPIPQSARVIGDLKGIIEIMRQEVLYI